MPLPPEKVPVGWQPGEWPAAWSEKRRIRTCLVLVAAAFAGEAIMVAATPNPRGYIYVDKFAHPVAGWFVSLITFALTAYIGISAKAARTAVLSVIATVIAVSACGWSMLSPFQTDPPTHRTVLATFHHYTLTRYTDRVNVGDDSYPAKGYVLFVEYRDGIFSRAGHQEIACFVAPGEDADPSWTLASARFMNDNTVEMATRDEATWVASFTSDTLRPVTTVDRCSNWLPDD